MSESRKVRGLGRPTIKDVARASGFSRAAVSMALRKDPSIPEETQKRIRRVADDLGYRPDPMLSALASSRWSPDASKFHGVLAWLDNSPNPSWHQKMISRSLILQGVRAQAKELGYEVETFWLRDPKVNHARLSRVLYQRGIQGVIIGPQTRPRARLNLRWDWFSVMTVGHGLHHPQFHRVEENSYFSINLAVRKLRALGYRRLGLVLSAHINAQREYLWEAGFLYSQKLFLEADRIPLFLKEAGSDSFKKWFKTYEPQVILTHDEVWLRQQLDSLQPQAFHPLAICSLVLREGLSVTGILGPRRLIGKLVADRLVYMIYKNERGIPDHPETLLVNSEWFVGSTVPRLTRSIS
jgi:LacI family transcriptional regulator